MGYDYGYVDYNVDSLGILGNILGGLFVFFIILLLVAFVIGIIQLIAFWKIYKKAGKGGWEAIIPFYCNWVLVEIAELNWWWFLLFFAPLVTSFIGLGWLGYLAYLFATFTVYYNISKKFNKGVGFAICFTIFTPICACILGFSKKNVYDKNIKVSNNGLFGATNNNTDNTNVNTSNYEQSKNEYNQHNNNFNQVQEPTPLVQTQVMEQPVQLNEPSLVAVAPQVNQNSVQQKVQSSNCPNCGTKVNPGDRFCMSCGNRL